MQHQFLYKFTPFIHRKAYPLSVHQASLKIHQWETLWGFSVLPKNTTEWPDQVLSGQLFSLVLCNNQNAAFSPMEWAWGNKNSEFPVRDQTSAHLQNFSLVCFYKWKINSLFSR